MSKLLDEVFTKLHQLPEADQDSIAAWLIEELESKRRWESLFAGSADALGRLADEALAEGPDPEEIYGPTTPWQRGIEEKRLGLEDRLKAAIDTGARPATVSRYRNQLAKLPPVNQHIRDRLLELQDQWLKVREK